VSTEVGLDPTVAAIGIEDARRLLPNVFAILSSWAKDEPEPVIACGGHDWALSLIAERLLDDATHLPADLAQTADLPDGSYGAAATKIIARIEQERRDHRHFEGDGRE
jgi:hypothetical protein